MCVGIGGAAPSCVNHHLVCFHIRFQSAFVLNRYRCMKYQCYFLGMKVRMFVQLPASRSQLVEFRCQKIESCYQCLNVDSNKQFNNE